jgi:hypothetical protein
MKFFWMAASKACSTRRSTSACLEVSVGADDGDEFGRVHGRACPDQAENLSPVLAFFGRRGLSGAQQQLRGPDLCRDWRTVRWGPVPPE